MKSPRRQDADDDQRRTVGQGADALGRDRWDNRIAIEASLLPPLFDRLGVAMVSTDAAARITAVSPAAELLLGFGEDELLGAAFHERVHYQHSDGSLLSANERLVLTAVDQARAGEGDSEVFVRKDGTTVPVAWAVAPIVLAGVCTGAVIVFYEDRKPVQAAAREAGRFEAVQAANIRLTLLADASHALISASDLHTGLAEVARLLVPAAADWVVLDLLDDQTGRLVQAALAHRNPDLQVQGLARLGDLPRLRPDMTSPTAQVLHGAPAVHLTGSHATCEATDELHAARLELFHLLGTTDAIVAPMRTRTRTVGAITLARSDPTRPFHSATDLPFVEALATRAAFAIENATLLEQYGRRAETMQRALLPDVPARFGNTRLGHLYRPADDLLQVGGDWYDAFCLADDSIALVIGDIAGHDLHAATRMGAVRHKLRGIAGDRPAPPSDVVSRLDAVVQRLNPGDLATLIYARLAPHPPEASGTASTRAPHTWSLDWSSAGHPPPLLLTPGQAPRLLPTLPDPPIGVTAARRADQRLVLPERSTVVLYTDGLIERSGEPINVGLARLTEHAAALDPLQVEELPERLLEAVQPAATDDIAVLAVHVS